MDQTRLHDIEFGIPFDETNEDQQRECVEKIVVAARADGVDVTYKIVTSTSPLTYPAPIDVKEWEEGEERKDFRISFSQITNDQMSKYYEMM